MSQPESDGKFVKGVMIHALDDLFSMMQTSEDEIMCKCSYFEIYNDQIYDLLANINQLGESLHVIEDS